MRRFENDPACRLRLCHIDIAHLLLSVEPYVRQRDATLGSGASQRSTMNYDPDLLFVAHNSRILTDGWPDEKSKTMCATNPLTPFT